MAHEWYGNLYLRLRGSDFCPIGVASGSETMRSQKTELACPFRAGQQGPLRLSDRVRCEANSYRSQLSESDLFY